MILSERKIYQVSEINSYLRSLLEADPLLSDLWVRGEISNFKHHSSGHIYFTLKDQSSCLRCVMFRSSARRLSFPPTNGMRVLARGYFSLYERDGLCQFYVKELTPDGQGALYQAFCQLKERLEKEGLFAPEHKRSIPSLPRGVGVVTSPTGAAWRDISTVIKRRFSQMPVVLSPSAVQGEGAPEEICSALNLLNERQDIDLIILGRGGGSLEELWAFNTEEVARAIFHSGLPVVSAVGHETDYTIADLVADLRAPTPSAAAEMVVPCRAQLEERVCGLMDRLTNAVEFKLQAEKECIYLYSARNMKGLIGRTLTLKKQEIDGYSRRLLQMPQLLLDRNSSEMKALSGKLEALSPFHVLKRGYSMCLDSKSGELIQDSSSVEKGDQVTVILRKGSIDCTVNEIKGESQWSSRNTQP
jgi:exodeoxyribonuclease VII large subunit